MRACCQAEPVEALINTLRQAQGDSLVALGDNDCGMSGRACRSQGR